MLSHFSALSVLPIPHVFGHVDLLFTAFSGGHLYSLTLQVYVGVDSTNSTPLVTTILDTGSKTS